MFDWETFRAHFFDTFLLQAALLTVGLSVVAQVIGTVLGLIAALAKSSRFFLFRWLANAYILIFRGTPLLVQLLLIYEGLPKLHIPFLVLDGITAAIIGLSLNEGAYMAEIIRAGIESIETGQMEAAKSLGMTYGLAMRRIVLPQAAKVILPPLGNEFNNMLKSSSLASVIAVEELTHRTEELVTATFASLELWLVAAFYYLVMTSIWSLIQSWLESKLNVGREQRNVGQSWMKRLTGAFSGGVLR